MLYLIEYCKFVIDYELEHCIFSVLLLISFHS